jgi:hypothetical protein
LDIQHLEAPVVLTVSEWADAHVLAGHGQKLEERVDVQFVRQAEPNTDDRPCCESFVLLVFFVGVEAPMDRDLPFHFRRRLYFGYLVLPAAESLCSITQTRSPPSL